MTLNKYYRIAMFIPAGLVIAFNLIFGIVQLNTIRGHKSEWLSDNSVFLMTIILVFLNSIFICGLSLTIFLNKKKKVRENIALSALSWFLLPGIWIGYIWTKHLSYLLSSQNSFDSESVFVFSNTIPFMIGLIYTFTRFQFNEGQKNKKY